VQAESAQEAPRLVDLPLAAHQARLLKMAFNAASVLPDRPHIKNKARFQEEVLEEYLELGQLRSVHERLPSVPNWRRGALYGKLAVACLERGIEGDVTPWLEEAEAIAKGKLGDLGQDWRRDSILVELAHARELLGREGALAELDGRLDPAQRTQLELVRASLLNEDDLDAHVRFLEALLGDGQGQFEDVQAGLEATAELLMRFYDDVEVRERLIAAVKASWSKMPVGIQLQMHVRLGRAAAAAGDLETARHWAGASHEFVQQYKWLEQDYVAALSDVAVLRFESGAEAEGIALADEAFVFFRENGSKVTDMFRGDGLRPLAEAYAEMGQLDVARSVYSRALDEALVNPNIRPRSHDLARTLTSMAKFDVQPDERLWALIARVYEAIGGPENEG
jgi:tetratricopeptide (TPR) repeat protein